MKQQVEDEAGVTEEELWDKVIRSVLTRFSVLDDNVVKPQASAASSKVGESEAEYYMKLKKYAGEKAKYEIYQTLLQRDKEIFQMRLDIFELKRMFLEHYAHPELIGQRPKYTHPPKVNIRMPTPVPTYQPPPQSPLQKSPAPTGAGIPSAPTRGWVGSPPDDYFGHRRDRNNEIFRSIMNSKSQEGMDVLGDGGENGNPPLDDDDEDAEFGLSGSWENIPPTECSGE